MKKIFNKSHAIQNGQLKNYTHTVKKSYQLTIYITRYCHPQRTTTWAFNGESWGRRGHSSARPTLSTHGHAHGLNLHMLAPVDHTPSPGQQALRGHTDGYI